eukprot:3933509-Rhodomonas_salina.1
MSRNPVKALVARSMESDMADTAAAPRSYSYGDPLCTPPQVPELEAVLQGREVVEPGTYPNRTDGSACLSYPSNTNWLMGGYEITDCIWNIRYEGSDGVACRAHVPEQDGRINLLEMPFKYELADGERRDQFFC